jgi:hypothetical protein
MCLFIITFPTTTTQRNYELGGNQFAPIQVHEDKGLDTLKKCLATHRSCSHDNAHLQLGFQQI